MFLALPSVNITFIRVILSGLPPTTDEVAKEKGELIAIADTLEPKKSPKRISFKPERQL